ncbi:hypothetical protein SAY86_011477 [Trapa natans]|uniref:Uncharacterized protein n=1 Tax=Trapa natans TaxID=22666 RepID=A0AAN7LM92_TRANT|nr:hypothetical protein SAY86_011477 [Trapa natans]
MTRGTGGDNRAFRAREPEGQNLNMRAKSIAETNPALKMSMSTATTPHGALRKRAATEEGDDCEEIGRWILVFSFTNWSNEDRSEGPEMRGSREKWASFYEEEEEDRDGDDEH